MIYSDRFPLARKLKRTENCELFETTEREQNIEKGTDYSDGTDIIALIEEIRDSQYYIPELSFAAELDGNIVGHFMFSRFPLSSTVNGGYLKQEEKDIVMLAPVAVHADYFHQGIGYTILVKGIERDMRCQLSFAVKVGAENGQRRR